MIIVSGGGGGGAAGAILFLFIKNILRCIGKKIKLPGKLKIKHNNDNSFGGLSARRNYLYLQFFQKTFIISAAIKVLFKIKKIIFLKIMIQGGDKL